MLSIRKIKEAYGNCLNWATLWLNDNDYQVNTSTTILVKPNGAGDVIVRTTETLHFRGWPYRDGSNEKVDILASMIETISLEDEACKKATVSVDYLRIDGENVFALESLLYHYKLPPELKHAICHVQNSNKVLNKVPKSLKHDPDPAALRGRFQNARVPSAFVNLPGLFAILAADHMSQTEWREFMEDCLVHFKKVPAVPEDAFIYGAIRKKRLCAWAWYEM